MSKLITALFLSAGLGLAGPALAQMYGPKAADMPMSKDAMSKGAMPRDAMSRDAYNAAKASADAQYKIDKDACSSMSGNANDVCVADAKGKESIAKAEAEAAYERTPKAREAARVAHAQANYDVAIEKCDDLAGNVKDVCVKEAKAQLVKGTSDAKVDRVTTDSRQDAGAKQAEARKEADEASRNAEYQVAIEKCDAQAGAAKDACVSGAKLRFGKS